SQPAWRLPLQFLTAFNLIYFLLFCALFPDGRFVPRWTRAVALVWVPFVLYEAFNDHPLGFRHEWLIPSLWLGGWGAGVAAQVHRYARVSGAVHRQQTKWVVLGVAAPVLALTVLVGVL